MEEHNCQYLLIQAMQGEARALGAQRQHDTMALESQRADQARLDREKMNAVIADVQKKFEADRLAMAQAAGRRERELIAHMSSQTAAAQQRAEEAENKI
eukprot:8004658-Pyramimonas_sp.AAC.1